jgi:hypothetical protein
MYMDNLNCVAQGNPDQQHRVTELVLRAIKETYPSIPGEQKDSVSLKKALAGDGDWNTVKEILGWVIDTDSGTLRLLDKRLSDLRNLLNIPSSQRRISRKKLERLIGKLHSMHLAIPSAIGHFYNIQKALTHASSTTAYLSNAFHEDIAHWRTLINAMALRPTYIAEIVQRVPTDLGFTDASGQGGGSLAQPKQGRKTLRVAFKMACRHHRRPG